MIHKQPHKSNFYVLKHLKNITTALVTQQNHLNSIFCSYFHSTIPPPYYHNIYPHYFQQLSMQVFCTLSNLRRMNENKIIFKLNKTQPGDVYMQLTSPCDHFRYSSLVAEGCCNKTCNHNSGEKCLSSLFMNRKIKCGAEWSVYVYQMEMLSGKMENFGKEHEH